MAKPVARPSWLSFYHPLSGQVWTAVLASTLVVCVILVTIIKSKTWRTRHGRLSVGAVVLEAVGSLLGQGLYGRLSTSRSNHILVASWLFFGVVVGTAYRGSLIAFLTLPRQPPRPETIEELVSSVERVTMGSYGGPFKTFYSNSNSSSLRALGHMIQVGIHVLDGLNDALVLRSAHFAGDQYMELKISKHFTSADGTTALYIGREGDTLTPNAWPVPHDAPFKFVIDRNIIAITEAGLYEQWRKETLEETARANRLKKREELQVQLGIDRAADSSSKKNRSLTITHIQGPLLLLLLGLTIGSAAFLGEKWHCHRYNVEL